MLFLNATSKTDPCVIGCLKLRGVLELEQLIRNLKTHTGIQFAVHYGQQGQSTAECMIKTDEYIRSLISHM